MSEDSTKLPRFEQIVSVWDSELIWGVPGVVSWRLATVGPIGSLVRFFSAQIVPVWTVFAVKSVLQPVSRAIKCWGGYFCQVVFRGRLQ